MIWCLIASIVVAFAVEAVIYIVGNWREDCEVARLLGNPRVRAALDALIETTTHTEDADV
jgi:hypothetical protein